MTIINNEVFSDSAKLRISNPYIYVADPDTGAPLAFASLYFGLPGKSPLEASNQQRVYAIQEDGSIIPISQPVKTSAGGVPEYNGSPVSLATNGDYSYQVLNAEGEQKYYSAIVSNLTLLEAGITSIIDDSVVLADSQSTVQFDRADTSQSSIIISSTNLTDPSLVDSRTLLKDIDYLVTDGGEGIITLINTFPAGTIINARQNTSTDQESAITGVGVVYSLPKLSLALPINFSLNDTVYLTGLTTTDDGLGGRYLVVPESTAPADGKNYFDLDNNLQLKLVSTQDKFQTFSEKVGVATILSSSITINMNEGTVHTVTIDENISGIDFVNLNAETDRATTVNLFIKQDSTGGRSVDFTGFVSSGGVSPTLTADPDATDEFIFKTIDGGATWSVYLAALDAKAIV